ncbi:MAG TPA: ATP-binding cassette domain-containing protein, partial [Alphaproteobacteria bacterium]|nr:ATP-binding cassette domain-containing protein [Alphaproteobacteria bacterium]
SLLENIRYGCENITMQEIQEACLAAHLNDVVESLPDGLYTQVGVKGVKLSGGQKQRVAIARAYLRRPELILLDEATSSLDSISEDHVQKGLSKLMGRSSSLIIAHRLSTVIKCDKIIVLDKGSVVDMGTHGELLNKCSLYKELSLKQFSKPLVT